MNDHQKNDCGRKTEHEDFEAQIKVVPLKQQRALGNVLAATGIPITILHKRFKNGSSKSVESLEASSESQLASHKSSMGT